MASGDKDVVFCGVDTSAIPILWDGIQLSYLAEGAANIIYRLSMPLGHQSAIDPELPPHLLRLRKGVPSAIKNLPAFSEYPAVLIERENWVLKEREASGNRPAKRAGLYLIGPPPDTTPYGDHGLRKLEQYEHYGFLVEDMTPKVDISRREVLVEFKPKWLLPSPTAPRGARRCRTCALRALRAFEKHGVTVVGNGSPNLGYWCPFDLGSGEPQRVRRAVKSILMQKGALKTGWKGGISVDERVILENAIIGLTGTRAGPVELFGRNGDINTEPLSKDGRNSGSGAWGDECTEGVKRYLMAMTVRDFSLFLKVDLLLAATPSDRDLTTTGSGSVQAKMGDLDLKSPENGKAKHLIDIERKLIDEGWYAGHGGGGGGGYGGKYYSC